jgi:polyisoprenoid-binding protein YceI
MPTLSPAPGRWLLDPARSTVAIAHKTMWGMVTVKGTFTARAGHGEVREDGTASGTLILDAASINTKHAKRDKHLRSADFFHTDEYRSIVFTANKAAPAANGTVTVDGELTVGAVTRPLSFTAQAAVTGSDSVTLTGEVTVDRSWFGLTWNTLGMMRGLATVTLSTRFVRDAG